MQRRINVDSGRPLEAKAQYSRAIRVNELVLQSGTTAIDLDGNIIGDTAVEQTQAIFDIAKSSMDLAEGHFEDIVRIRAFIIGRDNIRPVADAITEKIADQHFALTLIPTSQLARPTQLVEIELEALDGARANVDTLVWQGECTRPMTIVRLRNRVLFSGVEITLSNIKLQLNAILSSLEQADIPRQDLCCLRIFVSDKNKVASIVEEISAQFAGIQPVVSIIVVSAFEDPQTVAMVEAEAYIDAGARKQTIGHPQHPAFAHALVVDEHIFLSNIEPLDENVAVMKPNDWGAQRDICITRLQVLLEQLGASLDDVINRRYFTRLDVEQNRGYGDGPAWFETTRPAALGCRIENHLHDGTALTLEAHAIKGAGENIEWRTLTR